jgi:hypothetical protein
MRLILLLLLMPMVFAQGTDLDILLIEYNPETHYARIQIENNLQQDLHNVKFQLNTLPQTKISSTLKQTSATAKVLNVPPGLHKITITSDEITKSKELLFQASITETQSDFEKKKLEIKRSLQKEKSLEKILEKNAPVIQEKRRISNKTLMVSIGVIVLILITYFIISKLRSRQE